MRSRKCRKSGPKPELEISRFDISPPMKKLLDTPLVEFITVSACWKKQHPFSHIELHKDSEIL